MGPVLGDRHRLASVGLRRVIRWLFMQGLIEEIDLGA